MSDNDWTVVTANNKKRVMRKTRARYRPQSSVSVTLLLDQSSILSEDGPHPNVALHEFIERCNDILSKSDLLKGLCNSVQEWSKLHGGSGCIDKVVAYGIGNFSKTKLRSISASLWQLSLALCLRKVLCPTKCSASFIDFFDPCTTVAEATFLRECLNVNVLTTNDQGDHNTRGIKTLFFMPHCPSQLYENVVWSNFFNLSDVIFVGNSLRRLAEWHKESVLQCLQQLLPCLDETPLVNSTTDYKEASPLGNFVGAWNDTYICYYHSHQEWGGCHTSKLRRPYESLNSNSTDTELL